MNNVRPILIALVIKTDTLGRAIGHVLSSILADGVVQFTQSQEKADLVVFDDIGKIREFNPGKSYAFIGSGTNRTKWKFPMNVSTFSVVSDLIALIDELQVKLQPIVAKVA